jgi:very-short-patch-repair endonuclease
MSPDAKGANRGSGSEAFPCRRLETLPEAAGRFRLNAEIPIIFERWMKVNLLCEDLSIATALDGGQHLGDAEAYRRDRSKDLLLYENGYLMLRFPAEDVGKRLDTVLDAILRALAHRRRT